MGRRILVLDHDAETGREIERLLAADGHEVVVEPPSGNAIESLIHDGYHLLISDWKRPDFDAAALLTRVRSRKLPIGVIILTAHGDPATALEAMKAGADDFLLKPFDPERFRHIAQRILARLALIEEREHLKLTLRDEYGFHGMVSKSTKLRRVFDLIAQVGPHNSTVLIQGQTGTGKELVARAIHQVSERRRGPWVPLNCAALSDSLLESELFGHERGAFTGADRPRQGRFELADKGTLFLDEVGDVSPAMQVKLLRVLQTGCFERVGGTTTLKVDVRVVAATNKRLEDEVRLGRFRSDLYYRLNVVRIELPALSDRPEDIPLLAAHFLEKYRARSIPPVTEIHHEAMSALLDYSWPGNIRELENAIMGAIALADSPIIHREALPPSVAPPAEARPTAPPLIDVGRRLPDLTADLIEQVEREYFAQLLARHRGNVSRCARHSGLSRRSVTQKLQKYALNRDEFRFTD